MVAQNKRIKTSERCQRPPGRPEEKIVAAATVREIKPPALEEYQCKTGAAATEWCGRATDLQGSDGLSKNETETYKGSYVAKRHSLVAGTLHTETSPPDATISVDLDDLQQMHVKTTRRATLK